MKRIIILIALLLLLAACGSKTSEMACSDSENCEVSKEYFTLRLQGSAVESQKMEAEGYQRYGGDDDKAKASEGVTYERYKDSEIGTFAAVELVNADNVSTFAFKSDSLQQDNKETLYFQLNESGEIIPFRGSSEYNAAISDTEQIEKNIYLSDDLIEATEEEKEEYIPESIDID